MASPTSDISEMVGGMDPVLDDEVYRFVLVSRDIAPQLLGAAIGTFREDEGVTAIVPASLADEVGQAGPDFARITLQVNSDLQGVGLTAAAASALAELNIACNVVAAFHHDHLFVPDDRKGDALQALLHLSQDARR